MNYMILFIIISMLGYFVYSLNSVTPETPSYEPTSEN